MGVETAIIGGALIGAGVNYMAAQSASDSASDAAKAQTAAANMQYQLGQDQLAFAQQQYDMWESIYGPIQNNLSQYYQGLDANSVAAQEVTQIQESYQQQRDQVAKYLSQRGLSDSGAMGVAQGELATSAANAKALAVYDAPNQVAQQQASFLGIGLGQQGALQQQIAQGYQSQQNAQGTMAQIAANQQKYYNNMQQQAYAGLANNLSQAALGMGYFYGSDTTGAANSPSTYDAMAWTYGYGV